MMKALNHDGDAAENDPFSLLKLIAEASAAFIALTFVTGWSYLASYYKTFGLNPIELDVPVPVVATVALHMLYGWVWPLPVMAVVLALLAIFGHRLMGSQNRQRGWVVTALILVLFSSGAAALFRGRQMADSDIYEESANLPLVAFSSNSAAAKLGPPEQPSCVAFETFGTMDCKLLLHSRAAYYFFRPIPKKLAERNDKLDLYMLPDSEVLGVHIQRGLSLHKVEK
jgi:hypothetical protein